MNIGLQTRARTTSILVPPFASVRSRFLRRKQALVATPGLTGELAGFNGEQLVSQPPLIQPKLTVGQPNDRYEQEADRVAEQVMRMPDPRLQRQVELEEEEEEETLQAKPLAAQITPLVQRQVEPEEEEEEEEPIQAKRALGPTPEVTPSAQAKINSIRGSGKPLPESTRAFFEPRLGHDFSQVRVHTGDQATETTQALNARAFTIGENIVFGTGQYVPWSSAGRRLLAHELTHVVQQAGERRGLSNVLQRAISFGADFKNISLRRGGGATITGNDFEYEDAQFSADAEIVAIGDSIPELNDWDVGILQDLTTHWDRYYWRRANTDGRGRFVERKHKPVRTRFRDQEDGASTVWSADSEHQLLSGLAASPVAGRFQVSTTINTSDVPGGPEAIHGSSVPGMDASDGTRNIHIQRTGGRFDTYFCTQYQNRCLEASSSSKLELSKIT